MDVGPGWQVLRGTWAIQNNQLDLTDNTGFVDEIVANAGRSDVSVSVNFTPPKGPYFVTGMMGIVLRALDAQNYWMVVRLNNQLYLYKVQAGQSTLVAGPVTIPIDGNGTYTLTAVAVGSTITCYLNGVQYLQYTGRYVLLEGETWFGIMAYRDPGGSQPLVPINSFEVDTA